jgi:small subunit ribosomal protein S20
MKTRSFKNIEDKQVRKKAKKSYCKLRKSQRKQRDLIRAKERQERKKEYRALIKKPLKEIERNLKEKSPDLTKLEKLFSQFQESLDKAAQKRIIHKNKANRKKSRNRQKINKLIKQNNLNNPITRY